MTQDAKTKPCPFCAGTDIRFDAHPRAGTGWEHRGKTVYSMCCYDCGATFPNRYRKELLVEAWNRRALRDGEATEGARKWLGELLAIIHRDGGQYQVLHGDEKAVADAHAILAAALTRNVGPVVASEAVNEIWDNATNAVCQTMQERGMCNCPDGDCLAAKVRPGPADYALPATPPVAQTGTVGAEEAHQARANLVAELRAHADTKTAAPLQKLLLHRSANVIELLNASTIPATTGTVGISDALKHRLWEALRFSASRSVITAADESEISAAFQAALSAPTVEGGAL